MQFLCEPSVLLSFCQILCRTQGSFLHMSCLIFCHPLSQYSAVILSHILPSSWLINILSSYFLIFYNTLTNILPLSCPILSCLCDVICYRSFSYDPTWSKTYDSPFCTIPDGQKRTKFITLKIIKISKK